MMQVAGAGRDDSCCAINTDHRYCWHLAWQLVASFMSVKLNHVEFSINQVGTTTSFHICHLAVTPYTERSAELLATTAIEQIELITIIGYIAININLRSHSNFDTSSYIRSDRKEIELMIFGNNGRILL